MKKILLTVAATAVLAAALPAAAQSYDRYDRDNYRPAPVEANYGGYNNGYGGRYDASRQLDQRRDEIQRRIDIGIRRGDLSATEGRDMKVKLNQIAYQQRVYIANDRYLSRNEADAIGRRLARLDDLLTRNLRDNDRGPGGYYYR